MELFVARQPIFDAHLNVRAYEMLFRSGTRNAFDGTEANMATSKVISALFGSAESEHLLGDKTAYINFPRTLLLEDTALVLPAHKTVIEILETVEPDEAVVAACSRLRARGYRLALDDFVPAAAPHPLLPIADILKVDFRLATPAEQQEAATRFGSQLCLLAEKVETREEFRRARRLGYELFQGYFFARPEIAATPEIPGVKLNYLRILQEVHRSDLDFTRLSALLRREPSLSYKLLRFVNSALFARPAPLHSIHHALAFAGEEAVRKWLTVVALLDLASDQPAELALNALVRARFSELLATGTDLRSRSDDCFLMGMFSRLDAMLGRPLEELLTGLNLNPEIVRALLDRPEPGDRLPDLWMAVRAYETGDWNRLIPLASSLKIKTGALASCYTQAVSWADAAGTMR